MRFFSPVMRSSPRCANVFCRLSSCPKKYYDAGHRDVEFQVGDWVWLRLLNRTAHALSPGAKGKLGPCYAGPFRVLER